MIEIRDVTVTAGGFTLGPLDLVIPAGGYAVVLGPTGSGKTTLLEAVAGHRPIAAGRIAIAGTDVTAAPPERRALGLVPQHYHLFPHLTVGANIGYGLAQRRAAERAERVREVAALLEVEPLLSRGVGDLSGGERQRVTLARALAPRPHALLLDEPFAALDPATRDRLRDRLRTIHQHERLTTIHVTHDFEDALRLGDQALVLLNGRSAQVGTPDAVFRAPASPEVAGFVGAGTVLPGRVVRTGGSAADPLFPARFESAGLTLDVLASREGPAHAVIRPEQVVIARGIVPGSARNQLPAVVRRLEQLGPVVRVHLDAGEPLVALVTATAAETLGLAIGQPVTAAIKATAVQVL